jgi:hypothetical protein
VGGTQPKQEMLVAADGSKDFEINFEGLEDHEVGEVEDDQGTDNKDPFAGVSDDDSLPEISGD